MEASEDTIHKIMKFFGEGTWSGGGGDRLREKTPWVSTWFWEFKKCTLTPPFLRNIKPERQYKE
jgi:hypothetical protein